MPSLFFYKYKLCVEFHKLEFFFILKNLHAPCRVACQILPFELIFSRCESICQRKQSAEHKKHLSVCLCCFFFSRILIFIFFSYLNIYTLCILYKRTWIHDAHKIAHNRLCGTNMLGNFVLVCLFVCRFLFVASLPCATISHRSNK